MRLRAVNSRKRCNTTCPPSCPGYLCCTTCSLSSFCRTSGQWMPHSVTTLALPLARTPHSASLRVWNSVTHLRCTSVLRRWAALKMAAEVAGESVRCLALSEPFESLFSLEVTNHPAPAVIQSPVVSCTGGGYQNQLGTSPVLVCL